MTADHLPLPGEHGGRHRPERLYPAGLELHHLIARSGHKWQAAHHTHHSLETTP